MRLKLMAAAFSLALALLVLECGSALLVEGGVIDVDPPSYSLPQWRSSLGEGQRFWADIDPHFGVWHEAGSSLHHVRECFDVRYQANSHGMRDPERSLEAPLPRAVVLGDSQVEGFGVRRGARLTDRLEAATGIEHLNFGTAGDFSPLQYYLLYRNLARDFAHDTVVVGFFPFNDFRDGDIDFGKRVYADRYRPYWVGRSPDYELVYYRQSLDGPTQRGETSPIRPTTLLRDFTYSYNALRYAWRLWQAEQSSGYSGFYDFGEEELLRAWHSLRLLREAANGKRVVLLLLPVRPDLLRFQQEGPSPLSERMAEFAREQDMELIDLLPPMAAHPERFDDYILPCDGHWSENGHQAAFESVLPRLWPERNAPAASSTLPSSP